MAELSETKGSSEPQPAPIQWRRVAGLVRPLRRGVAAMVALTVTGVLVGLIPPVALGLLGRCPRRAQRPTRSVSHDRRDRACDRGEAAAYIASDGMYARNASHLYMDVRLQMFEGRSAGQTRARTAKGSRRGSSPTPRPSSRSRCR